MSRPRRRYVDPVELVIVAVGSILGAVIIAALIVGTVLERIT